MNSQAVETSKIIDSLLKASSEANKEYRLKESLELANKIIELASEEEDYTSLAKVYNIIGINYEIILDYANAEKNYQKSLHYAEKAKNNKYIGRLYNNLGNVYGDGFKEFKKSLYYYEKSLEKAEELGDSIDVYLTMINIGWTYVDMEEYDEAFPHLKRVQDYLKNNKEEQGEMQVKYLLGKYYVYKGQYKKAEQLYIEARDLGEENDHFLELTDIYMGLSELYKKNGKIDKALTNLEKHNFYKNKIFNEDRLKQLEVTKARLDADEYRRDLELKQKEHEAQEKILKKSKQLALITGLGVLVLFVLLMLLLTSIKHIKHINKELEIQNNELEKAKEGAEKLSNMKSQFISTVSHELRTPLYGVVGLTSLLLEEKNLSKREHQYLKSLKFSGDYLLNLINNVLQLSKIESNKVVIEKTRFNLKQLGSNIISSFEFQAEQKRNKLEFKYDENIPVILFGDSVRLSQILINLIGNAIKFTYNGKIVLAMQLVSKNENNIIVNIEVSDNGIGISQKDQEQIFENFSQIDRESSEYQGTGLGLSIVKRLVELFGSKIILDSDIGKGSVFSFTLDFGFDSSDKVPDEEYQTTFSLTSKNQILIVEDNRINQIVTQSILQKAKFKCDIVDNGKDAIKKVKNKHFDLVLMDLNMPKMNGIEATKRIRAFNKDIPIIALTALQIDEIKTDIYSQGINDIINKPYDQQEFFQIILKNLNAGSNNEDR